MPNPPCRRLILILGDQLDPGAPGLKGLDPALDRVWMCEARAEATHVPSHKARTVLFLSAMRHFRDRLRTDGIAVRYRALDRESDASLGFGLAEDLRTLRPQQVVLTQPGEHRVLAELAEVCAAAGVPLEVLEDTHFICPTAQFAAWAGRRTNLVLEHFYRHLRRRESVLMDRDQPLSGRWNLDTENRKPLGRRGPGLVPSPLAFPPDQTTRAVMDLVEVQFPQAPGRLDHFNWPVTPEQAQAALTDFIDHRLPRFGPYQDAMWTGQPYLYHARLSAALNLKLLDPRVPMAAAVRALELARAPLNSVEGFVRQILGWREYVRGVYWREGPDYLERNALDAHQPLPAFYWTGETEYACLGAVIGQVLDTGYAHHIQRLMVTGLFALLLGVEPRQVHAWYLAMFVDAVEWVEAPNTLGMSQYADGGLLASKPYAASGAYIRRMSNYCAGCRFDPGEALGERACPFTTLYWDFLARHQGRFSVHPRTALQWRNL
ncbi:MAG: cryptochrome/photolyase family protein, partial [Bdellovibrio bacteriovorus]